MNEFDVLLYKGNSIISNFIKSSTDSIYSHVALVIDDNILVETNWNYKLQKRFNNYKRRDYDLYRTHLTKTQKVEMRRYIDDTIGTNYDLKQVITHFFNIKLNTPILDSPNQVHCAEWIDEVFSFVGVDLVPNKRQGIITPSDISNSPILYRVG